MRTCACLIVSVVALGCAHEDRGVARGSNTKTQASSAPSEPRAGPTADASNSSRIAATSSEGKIPLSANPQAAELLRRAYDALFTTNLDTAYDLYRKALEQEPTFLAAQALLYDATPGAKAMRKVEEAMEAGARLPEAERTLLELLNADKHGDLKTSIEKATRLVELAPNDPISHIALGLGLLQGHRLDEALAEFQKASDLDPRLGAPYVQMAFIYDVQGKRDAEVAVLRKWVAARSDDSAAQSGLAGGLAAAGKLDEAVGAARKATTMGNAGYNTWLTLAYVEEMRGDWSSARADLTKARDLAPSGIGRAGIDEQTAFVDLGQRKFAAATADLDVMAKDAAEGGDPNDVVRANIDHAVVQLVSGKMADAVRTAKEAADRVANEPVSDAARGFLSREALTVAVWVDAVANKPRDAAEALAALEKASPEADKDAFQADALNYARGEVAWTNGDLRGAVEQFRKCIVEDDLCRFRLAAAQEKLGDRTGAAATRNAILDARHGDKFALLIRAWLTERTRKVAARD